MSAWSPVAGGLLLRRSMMVPRRVLLVVCGIVVLALLSPVWGFELLYCSLLDGEALPEPKRSRAPPTLIEDALWIAEGESPGAGVEALWAGNYFRPPGGLAKARGRVAGSLVARRLLYAEPARRLAMLEHHLRSGAVLVWLTRHSTETDLKRYLLEWSDFGRNSRGAADGAMAYFGAPLEHLSIAQVALLAGLPQSPSGLDPSCSPERALARRAYVLEQLRVAGRISAEQLERSADEPLGALPGDGGCPPGRSKR